MDDNCIPAIVISFDRDNNIATVKPLIRWIGIDDSVNSRRPFVGLNVLSLGGGGFHISFPIKMNDLGWILASDRDISLFKQSLAESNPNTGRLHKFEDGWFIPDVFRKYEINGADSDAMVIQSTDAATRISISAGHVNITAPVSATVDTPLTTFTGNVVIEQNLTVDENAEVKQNLTVDENTEVKQILTVDGATNLQAALTVTGSTNVNGGFHATGGGGAACELPANTTVGGTTVASHGHISSTVGTRTSGGMIT